MNFYNSTHRHYCGIDLHAHNLYVCILDQQGEALLHKEIPAKPEPLLHLIEPYLDNLIIGVECMHYWYWIADFCEDQGNNRGGSVTLTGQELNWLLDGVNLKAMQPHKALDFQQVG